MRPCAAWLHHQYAEENLDRCRQKRRVYVLFVVLLQLPLLLLANFNSGWLSRAESLLINSLTGFLLPEMWLLRGPRGGLEKKFSTLAIARHIFLPPHKSCCNSTTAFGAKIKQPRMTSKGHYACNLFQNIRVTYSYSFALNLLLGNINGAHSCSARCTGEWRLPRFGINYHRQRNFLPVCFDTQARWMHWISDKIHEKVQNYILKYIKVDNQLNKLLVFPVF